ncbi:hypothetical protein DYB37_003247 [Aphanomyces astaci]|uniref:Uncharacterized protein n=1 Tax=Aphanomyces astaci TaxID=112090 RepID=A0A3R7BK31_APHAT|nr:hypothetical protein DYB35_006029 [Aphanomyces astaci]RHZ14907.1 hypothetical protein DYB37_003247 [Aphanomyces astaci]
MSARGFGGFDLSPTKDQALLSAVSSHIMDLRFTVVCGKGLLAAGPDGLTSNCICDISLVSTAQKTLVNTRSRLVKSTRNPLWNLAVDFGRVDLKDIDGIRVVVKHSGGFTSSKPLGEAFVPVEFVAEGSADSWFPLTPTPDMPRASTYGDIRIVFPASTAAKASPAAAAIQHSPVAELSAIKACHQAVPRPGQFWFAVAAPWVEAWLVWQILTSADPAQLRPRMYVQVFVSKLQHTTADAPGPIPNHFLLDNSSASTPRLRANLRLKQDYRYSITHSVVV